MRGVRGGGSEMVSLVTISALGHTRRFGALCNGAASRIRSDLDQNEPAMGQADGKGIPIRGMKKSVSA